jgi:hypothetical protein
MALAAATQHKETQNGLETRRSTDHTPHDRTTFRGGLTLGGIDWLRRVLHLQP